MNRLRELRLENNLTMKDAAKRLGLPYTTYVNYEKGLREPNSEVLISAAKSYGVTVDYLIGRIAEKENPLTIGKELKDMALVKFPVIGTISAGNGCCAYEEYTGDYTYFSATELEAEPDEYFVLQIRGDSMYPKLLDGDYVLVRRKVCVDSGRIAVVIFNGDEATVKKVKYESGEWLELVPINPEYKARRIEGVDLEQCRILGEVEKLQRDL